MSSLWSSCRRLCSLRSRRPIGRRNMGSNVWDKPDHEPSTARPFNRQAGEKVPEEGWEKIYIWGMGISFLTVAIGLYNKPETSLAEWARQEVLKEDGAEKYSLDRV